MCATLLRPFTKARLAATAVAAAPSVYNVVQPLGLEEYMWWISLLEFPAELAGMLTPAACSSCMLPFCTLIERPTGLPAGQKQAQVYFYFAQRGRERLSPYYR